jgi:hypothetical protein
VTYNYQPIIPNSWLNGIQIRYESGFNVRQRTNQSIPNVGNVTPRVCDTFNADRPVRDRVNALCRSA